MKKKESILLVEDDKNLGFVVKDNLEMAGYGVVLCEDGEAAEKVFEKEEFDLCLLDVMMPKKDGFTLATAIRKLNNHVPIVFLTAKSMKEDKVKGFTLGGDDYITKPFSTEELLLRIKAILRRTNSSGLLSDTRESFTIGVLNFDHSNLLISGAGIEKKLTKKEADILKLLCLYQNEILRREDALKEVWGENDYFNGRSMDVFITKLRKYLSADPAIKIENVHGVGFRLAVEQ